MLKFLIFFSIFLQLQANQQIVDNCSDCDELSKLDFPSFKKSVHRYFNFCHADHKGRGRGSVCDPKIEKFYVFLKSAENPAEKCLKMGYCK
ncbi:unnamed protein product [Caenorhabditis angaria]|uniref:Saposin B-type domain-containing protein n=1 Tax=Caenorhabditis angaria TaxID=860376 RepID=A0A9P1ITR2_9PELO|nr:unnamed protein product [Caenorhabditis angaria]